MKLKTYKNLKLDITGNLGSSFKRFRYLKDIKSNIFSKINRIRMDRNTSYRLRKLFIKIKLKGRKNRNLDFNSSNTKNVFLRTKRKSSFGQTLLEKQRLKFYKSYVNEKDMKRYFKAGNMFKNSDYVFNRSNMFLSKDSLKYSIINNKLFTRNDVFSYSGGLYSYPSLKYTKRKCFKLSIFDRIIPNNLIIDNRINKVKAIDSDRNLLPFKFNLKKVIQHYRLKRG